MNILNNEVVSSNNTNLKSLNSSNYSSEETSSSTTWQDVTDNNHEYKYIFDIDTEQGGRLFQHYMRQKRKQEENENEKKSENLTPICGENASLIDIVKENIIVSDFNIAKYIPIFHKRYLRRLLYTPYQTASGSLSSIFESEIFNDTSMQIISNTKAMQQLQQSNNNNDGNMNINSSSSILEKQILWRIVGYPKSIERTCGELLYSHFSSHNEANPNLIVDVHPTIFSHVLYVFFVPSVSKVVHFGIETKDEFLQKQESTFEMNENEDIDLKDLNIQHANMETVNQNRLCQQNHLNLAFKIFAAYREKYMPVSRAYFKMRELWFDHLLINEPYQSFLRSKWNGKGLNALDIGAAPGGWSQCLKNIGRLTSNTINKIVAVDPGILTLPSDDNINKVDDNKKSTNNENKEMNIIHVKHTIQADESNKVLEKEGPFQIFACDMNVRPVECLDCIINHAIPFAPVNKPFILIITIKMPYYSNQKKKSQYLEHLYQEMLTQLNSALTTELSQGQFHDLSNIVTDSSRSKTTNVRSIIKSDLLFLHSNSSNERTFLALLS